ncbi:HNH endonuclease signature motif containing protein [Kitasatospora cheerisanensis]|uniref:HNH endonuclease signature motif containing protein n=1 Tax=Kitasatospora cheerisanensis TaxID=81942 RepID=UPI0007C52D62|nr:HNH endonuclease signature motif containing protein [Kitasatospora cheerisanensis]
MAEFATRVFDRTDRTGDCWLWKGHKNAEGYAWTHAAGHHRLVHRFSYEALVGPIPVGFQIDHLCKVRHCVNPAHLEAVTPKVNVQRSTSANRRKTHCPQGHPYDEANTYRPPGRTARACRACRNGKKSIRRNQIGGAK